MSLKHDILAVLSKINISFHMPAHKYTSIIHNKISEIDTTEIAGTDNLHGAFHCIKESEDRISKIFDSKKSRIMVAGSSIGIIASIYALSNEGDRILIGRDSHKSVFNACKIAKISYKCIMPRLNQDNIPLDYDDFYQCLIKNPDIKLALITSPNYYGYIRQFTKIADEIDRRGGYLIVDEAHGCHLNFTHLKKYSGLNQNAHVVVQSAHKTLPAMTMAAVLHYGKRIDDSAIYKVDQALKIFQSSSPSYPIMISVDEACQYMMNNSELVELRSKEFKNLDENYFFNNKQNNIKDPFKIFVNTARMGYTGYEINDILIKKGIYPEFAQHNGVLLYLSVFNTKSQILQVYNLIKSLKKRKELITDIIKLPKLQSRKNKTRILHTKYEIIDIGSSLGRESMEDIIPYPPGIPIILEGEIITKEILDSLNSASKLPIGIIEGKNEVLRTIKVKKVKEELRC